MQLVFMSIIAVAERGVSYKEPRIIITMSFLLSRLVHSTAKVYATLYFTPLTFYSLSHSPASPS